MRQQTGKIILGILAIALVLAVMFTVDRPKGLSERDDRSLIARAKNAARATLPFSSTIKYFEVRIVDDKVNKWVCGLVDYKTRQGDFVGKRRFAYDDKARRVYFTGDTDEFERLWSRRC